MPVSIDFPDAVLSLTAHAKEDATRSHEVTRADLPGDGAWLAGKIAHAVMAYFY